MNTIKLSACFIFLLFSISSRAEPTSGAASPWSETRIFATFNKLSTTPDDLNAETAGDKVEPLKSITGFGLEGNAHILPIFKLGIRFGGSWTEMSPSYSSYGAPASFLAVQQAYGGFIGRFIIIENKLLRLDAYGEIGLTRTHIDVQTTTGSGTYQKDSAPYQRAGASLGLGWDTVFFFVEAGKQWNKLDGMTFQGNISAPVTSVDLSGMYYGVGFAFNGLPHLANSSQK